MEREAENALLAVLEEARRRKYLGPVSVESHLLNAASFEQAILAEPAATVVDLGSGGGVPALVLAMHLPFLQLLLVERGSRRAEFLVGACEQLCLSGRVEVLAADAAVGARELRWEGWADVVTARGFGPPGVTAECAARFLALEGRLVVSEPPCVAVSSKRWPAAGCAELGLVPTGRIEADGTTLQILRRRGELHDRYPRRPSAVAKRPVF